jgi:hypothetical protein
MQHAKYCDHFLYLGHCKESAHQIPCIAFYNMPYFFNGEEFVTTCPAPKLKNHPMRGSLQLLIQVEIDVITLKHQQYVIQLHYC